MKWKMKFLNLILEISSIFRIFLALFLKISRQFLISWKFLWNSSKISSNFRRKIANFIEKREWKMKFHFHSSKNLDGFLLKFWDLSVAKECKSCRSRKMLHNDPLVAIVAVDTAENEPLKVWGWFHSLFNPLLRSQKRRPPPGRRFGRSQAHPQSKEGRRPQPAASSLKKKRNDRRERSFSNRCPNRASMLSIQRVESRAVGSRNTVNGWRL